MEKTQIQNLGFYKGNRLCVKREDLIPFSFGGNKARKARLFFRDIERNGADCVVTYGSGSSNHCRVVANACCARGLDCYVICPAEASQPTFNSQMTKLFGAQITVAPVAEVRETIDRTVAALRARGRKPYFIQGGGHGDIGTDAYAQCYREIRQQEAESGVRFDYIFFASGTGTTQAGLVAGQLLSGDRRTIVGISIARKNPRGRGVVLDSIRSYLGDRAAEEQIQNATIFLDDYASGYAQNDPGVTETIRYALKQYGLPLDAVYTGKAFAGMGRYIEEKQIREKNILFLHTGGTPLFFDALRGAEHEDRV